MRSEVNGAGGLSLHRGRLAVSSKRYLGSEAVLADGECGPRWDPSRQDRGQSLGGKPWKGQTDNTGDQEQGGTWWGDHRAVSPGGPTNSPGSRSGLSPDRGCRETPGVSCPEPPMFRSREGPPRPPFRSVRPGFSAGETLREKDSNLQQPGGSRCYTPALSSPSPRRPLLLPQTRSLDPS